MGQPTIPTKPSIPLESVILVVTWIMGVETIKRQTRAAYGCLVAGPRVVVQNTFSRTEFSMVFLSSAGGVETGENKIVEVVFNTAKNNWQTL